MSNKIPQVDPFVLTKLKFAEDLYLSPVGLLQPEVTVLRERLIVAIRAAIIPLVAYCREYDKHSPLYSLDVDEYIELVYQKLLLFSKKYTFGFLKSVILCYFIFKISPNRISQSKLTKFSYQLLSCL